MCNIMVAGTFLKPMGWTVEGGMKWYPEMYHQVCFEAKVSDPNGLEQFEVLPWWTCISLSKTVVPIEQGNELPGQSVPGPDVAIGCDREVLVAVDPEGAPPARRAHSRMAEIEKLYAR